RSSGFWSGSRIGMRYGPPVAASGQGGHRSDWHRPIGTYARLCPSKARERAIIYDPARSPTDQAATFGPWRHSEPPVPTEVFLHGARTVRRSTIAARGWRSRGRARIGGSSACTRWDVWYRSRARCPELGRIPQPRPASRTNRSPRAADLNRISSPGSPPSPDHFPRALRRTMRQAPPRASIRVDLPYAFRLADDRSA